MTSARPVLRYVVLICFALVFATPVYWVIASAFKSSADLFTWPPEFWPKHPTLASFTTSFSQNPIGRYVWNSIFVSVTATVLTVILSTMAGFALAKFRFRGQGIMLVVILGTIMFPVEVIMIPLFRVIRELGLYDSLWGVIIPTVATPTGIFLLRQYMLSIPDDLIEAARLDGANVWQVFRYVIVPLARPAMAALAIFSFLWRWNDFLLPLVVLSDPHKYTMTLALANLSGEFNVNWNSLLALSVIAMIPVVIVFLALQRFFVRGIAMTGMK